MWDPQELANALADMAQTMWHDPAIDFYDPQHDGAAWDLCDLADDVGGWSTAHQDELTHDS